MEVSVPATTVRLCMGHRGPCVCGTRNGSEWGYVSQSAIPSDYQAKPVSKHMKWPGSQVRMSLRARPLQEPATRGSRPNTGKTLRSQAHLRLVSMYVYFLLCRRQLGRARIHGQPLDSPSTQACRPSYWWDLHCIYFPLKSLLTSQWMLNFSLTPLIYVASCVYM